MKSLCLFSTCYTWTVTFLIGCMASFIISSLLIYVAGRDATTFHYSFLVRGVMIPFFTSRSWCGIRRPFISIHNWFMEHGIMLPFFITCFCCVAHCHLYSLLLDMLLIAGKAFTLLNAGEAFMLLNAGKVFTT